MVAQPFVAAVQTDQLVAPIVVRLHVVIGDRPIVTQAVDALAPEVIGPESKRDAPPMIGASTEHAGAPPTELRPRSGGVRLTVDLPTAVTRVELAEWTSLD